MDALVPEEKDLSDQRLSNTVIINNQKIIYPYNRKIQDCDNMAAERETH